MFIIQSYVANKTLDSIMNGDTPKEAWETLREEFQGNERIKKLQILNLRREF